ncbi:MAG TPA: peptide deformylase [Leucothrix mucor]|nr:peptide deformylase [Leucothrix mucor]
MNEVSEIMLLGNPVLRCAAEEVTNIADSNIQKLIDSLLYTVKVAGGMGIAAPQVGELKRIMVMCSRPNSRYPQAPVMDETVMLNPTIIWKSKEMIKDWEGCLSLPLIRGYVPRCESIQVEYFTRDGGLIKADFDGFLARIFQHEYDHLNGKVFIDRLDSTTDMMMESEWLKLN